MPSRTRRDISSHFSPAVETNWTNSGCFQPDQKFSTHTQYTCPVQPVTKQKITSVWVVNWTNRMWSKHSIWTKFFNISTSLFQCKLNRNVIRYTKKWATAPCQVELDRIFPRHFSSTLETNRKNSGKFQPDWKPST